MFTPNDTIVKILFTVFRLYFETFETILRRIDSEYKRPESLTRALSALNGDKNTIDERIKKIDSARDNLKDAIIAIEELRQQATYNKNDLADALRRIDEAERQKQEIGKELDTIKQLAEADTVAFRRIVGLLTRGDVWRERLLGFCSGVLASIVASAVILIALKLMRIS